MKLSKNYLRNLIKECMQDMSLPRVGVSAPAILPSPPQQAMGVKMDPDGYEGRMAKGNLFRVAEYAMEMHNMIQDAENLEPWVEEKIAVAAQMIDSVAHYLKYEKTRGPQVGE